MARRISLKDSARHWLWAPWREEYLSTLTGHNARSIDGCLFCRKKDAIPSFRNLVVAKGKLSYTVMNLYPYNNGHILIVPYRHVGALERLTHAEWTDLLRLTQDATNRLKQVFSPEGYNIGINVGRAAGAGIPGHLHLHIVPRWNGDTNFVTIISNARVVSRSLRTAYRLLKAAGPSHVRS